MNGEEKSSGIIKGAQDSSDALLAGRTEGTDAVTPPTSDDKVQRPIGPNVAAVASSPSNTLDHGTGSNQDLSLSSSSGKSGKDEQEMNPQDGTLPELGRLFLHADFPVLVHDDVSSQAEIKAGTGPVSVHGHDEIPPPPAMKEDLPIQKSNRRKGNRRRPRVVSIGMTQAVSKRLTIPSNQYECTLVRRAVLPQTMSPSETHETDDGTTVYGDIALGMKLSIADTGHVIVQRVTPLADGKASPAQLTGMIRRGDVLLSIDGVSLAEHALAGLAPLRAPEDPTIPCQRTYKLRFSAREGLTMLQYIENRQINVATTVAGNPAFEMLALFPMVDQLSGMPLFQEEIEQSKENDPPIVPLPLEAKPETSAAETPVVRKRSDVPLYDYISDSLSRVRLADKRFYSVVDSLEEPPVESVAAINQGCTLSQRQDLGRQGMAGAKNLLKRIEVIDAGKDIRSFQSWNTTISLYSRASTRRRRVFDAASLPVKHYGSFDEAKEESSDVSCATGKSSTNSDQVDGDELLLRLAAHDEIWRRQVIEFLEAVRRETDDPSSTIEDEKKLEQPVEINAAMSSELGNFLFGDSMTKILATHKSPRTLPSEEVTAVLFDLGTKLSASIPDEIKASGTILSAKSELAPFTGLKRHADGSDVVLAARFLLDEALPAWLKSFRPLAWEHRRILWPVEKRHVRGSSLASTLSDDSLTVDTTFSNLQSPPVQPRRPKNIREIIEDKELDVETRGETCFLTTFYFIHSLLPRLMCDRQSDTIDKATDEIVVFLGEYGSYLRMDTCLAYAGVLKSETVVDLLLSIARHDPRHREVIRQMSRSSSMVFYESTMLSAVLQMLQGVAKETSRDRRQATIDVCAAAYPDVRPWQVQTSCRALPSDEGDVLYYSYLSMLLHPLDGHDIARHDASLVKEWCNLSVEEVLRIEAGAKVSYLDNFMSVASRASSHHLVYHRDLLFLLPLSMRIKEFGLAIDLAGEILEDAVLSKQRDALNSVLDQLRLVGFSSLDQDIDSNANAARNLRRILRHFTKPSFRHFFDVPTELAQLIKHQSEAYPSLMHQPSALLVVRYLAVEAVPNDLLAALAMCCSEESSQPELAPVLTKLLTRGASSGSEMSASLLKVKRARQLLGFLPEDARVDDSKLGTDAQRSTSSVWSRMSAGLLDVDK